MDEGVSGYLPVGPVTAETDNSARYEIDIAFLAKLVEAVSTDHTGEPATCEPCMLMSTESEIRGHSFSSSYHMPCEPGRPRSHPLNLWSVDDCAPAELSLTTGDIERVVFQGLLNPESAIPFPVRPFYECAVGAMRQIADWEYGGLQAVIPLEMPRSSHKHGHLFEQSLHETASGARERRIRPRLIADISLPCSPDVVDLEDVVQRWLPYAGVFCPVEGTTTRELRLPRLADVENLTEPVQQVSFVMTPAEWNCIAMGDLIGTVVSSLWKHSYDCRALTLNVCEESWHSSIPTEPIRLFSRFDLA